MLKCIYGCSSVSSVCTEQLLSSVHVEVFVNMHVFDHWPGVVYLLGLWLGNLCF